MSATSASRAGKAQPPAKSRPAPARVRPAVGKPAAGGAGKAPMARKAAARGSAAAEAAEGTGAPSPEGVAKSPKVKLVRDSFTIPRSEYLTLHSLKERLVKLTRPAKKSEVLRAGIGLLATLDDRALLAAIEAVPAIKTGRPKKTK